MTVPELAEPNTGNGTNESRPVPVLANCAFGYRTKWKISGSGIQKRTVLEMGASTGNGNASSCSGKLRVSALTFRHTDNMGISHQSIRAYEPYFAAAGDDECSSLWSPAWKQQATTFTFVVTLLLSFAIGSVTVLVAALLWHSELVMETTFSAHSSVIECPLIRLGVALHDRRRAAVRQCWATV